MWTPILHELVVANSLKKRVFREKLITALCFVNGNSTFSGDFLKIIIMGNVGIFCNVL